MPMSIGDSMESLRIPLENVVKMTTKKTITVS